MLNWRSSEELDVGPRIVHVYPLNDEKKHVLEGVSCWCKPRIETSDELGVPYPNGGTLIIHNAADCREIVEQAETIKRKVEDEDFP